MHHQAYTVRALIISSDGGMHLERASQTYATSVEARAVCDALRAAHQARSIRSLVQVHDVFGQRVDACDDC